MRNLKKKNTLLIDADITVHKLSIICEETICWSESQELYSKFGDLKKAKALFRQTIDKYVEQLGGMEVVLALSPRRNFRHDLNPDYKANRKKTVKPMIYKELREWACSEYASVCWENVEADDVLGVLAKSHTLPAPKIVVSDDHDMLGVPCLLYQPLHPERGLQRITYKAAERYHLYQTLMGDSGDGYPGLPGVGPKRAEEILKEGLWEEVVEAYTKRGLEEEDALLQARMAKILTPSLYDQKTKQLKLWKPRRTKCLKTQK